MSRITDRQLATKLRPDSDPEPPAGLLEELRRQIPERIEAPAPPEHATRALPFRRWVSNQMFAAAASVAVLVVGGGIAWVVVRQHVGIGAVTEPRPQADYYRDESFQADMRSPAEAPAASAETMQPRERQALGYAGTAPPAARRAPVPAYPGSFEAGGRGDRQAAPQWAAGPRPRVPGQPMEVAPAPAPVAGNEPRAEDVVATAEPPLLDERARSTSATVSGQELGRISTGGPPATTSPGAAAQVGAAAQRADTAAPAEAPARTRQEAPAAPEPVAVAPPPPQAMAPAPPPPAADRDAVRRDKERAGEERPAPTLPPSTGGTAEPNDQPYGDVFFHSYGVNPFVDSEDDRLSTFALDVDTGAYNVVRRFLGEGHLPPPEAVRVEQLVNAFDYGDPAPRQGDFALRAEGGPDPWAPGDRGYVLARFAVKAREVQRTGTLETVAREARAQVEVDPRFVARWRLIGYENRDVADERFRDDSLDAGEIGAGHTVTVLYELKLRPETPANATLAMLRLRWKPSGGGPLREVQQPLRRSDVPARWEKASPAFRLAAVVSRFAEVLRGSYWARQVPKLGDDLGELALRAAQVNEDWPRQPRVAELVRLIERARDLRKEAAAARSPR